MTIDHTSDRLKDILTLGAAIQFSVWALFLGPNTDAALLWLILVLLSAGFTFRAFANEAIRRLDAYSSQQR